NNLAWIEAENNGDLGKALLLAQTATTVTPDVPEIMDTLGWVYYKRDLPKLAAPLFARSAEKVPTNPIYHYHLGLANLRSGETRAGRRALERALEARPDEAAAADIRRLLSQLPAPSR
ncbi:MAG TPA: tetratricopeptide repeat protein, partial [Vicinamibacterales bacterium]